MATPGYGKYKPPGQKLGPAKRTPKKKLQKYDPNRKTKLIAVGPPKRKRKKK